MVRDRAAVLEQIARAHEERRAAGAPFVAALRSALPEAVETLRREFGVVRVWLFGSFARGTPTSSSDVDIAVEGLPGRDHLRAMAYLTDALGRTVDLVRLEELDARSRQSLLEEAIPA
jgi:predicted nucleotidyltransferase